MAGRRSFWSPKCGSISPREEWQGPWVLANGHRSPLNTPFPDELWVPFVSETTTGNRGEGCETLKYSLGLSCGQVVASSDRPGVVWG